MRINCQCTTEGVTFRATPEPGDPIPVQGVTLGRQEAFVRCPNGDGFGSPHPDLLALAALLVFRPWIGKTVDFPDLALSTEFIEAVKQGQRLTARGDVRAGSSPPRRKPDNGRPGLAFSGGVDSVAALEVLPAETALFFMSRVAPTEEFSAWVFSKDGPHRALDALRAEGRTVYSIETDLEFVRSPPGVPLDWSNGVPMVLMADRESLDAVTWGLILESAYRIGRADFQDWGERPGFTRWALLFASVGLDMFHPVAGLSEIITSKLVMSSPHGTMAQSCVRGPGGAECGECPKCFRKMLLSSALGDRGFDFSTMARFWRSKRVLRTVTVYPIKHQNVLAYSLLRHDFEDAGLLAIQRMILASHPSFDLYQRHYAPALELVPEKYRTGVAERIGAYAAPMSAREEIELRAWSMPNIDDDADILALHQDCVRILRRSHEASLAQAQAGA
ncbi:hypothetical protein GCM10011521_01180 [Arenimonas soli]|uniref:7-cyano-7-deazaguanine synthase n=1 Tax=Arenimonas soli TaxID=2269504 RepID=A0ABQ1HB29_9GAMM|nr:DUF6395 domain-containing protein [Arenimonas soli]GGA66827.1 hypothetical protein GCM10011521_01180 [Arenimonas soli]